jgi:hypothetical protein
VDVAERHDGLLERTAAQHNISPSEEHMIVHTKDKIQTAQADIAVDEQKPMTARCHSLCQAGADCRFADTAFAGRNSDPLLHGIHLFLGFGLGARFFVVWKLSSGNRYRAPFLKIYGVCQELLKGLIEGR